MVKTWDGATLKPCKDCGKDDWEHLEDEDHDMGSCQVFRCKACKITIHVELPD